MNGKQLFNLIPPILPKLYPVSAVTETVSCIPVPALRRPGYPSLLNKISLSVGDIKDKEELFENKDWIILAVKNGRFLMRNANAEPGKLCNVYLCDNDMGTIKVVSATREYFREALGIEVKFQGLEFSGAAGRMNNATKDFLDKLKEQCITLTDCTANMLKEWKDYVRYEKTTVDMLHRCRINLYTRPNGDVVVKFLKDTRFYDEFSLEDNEYIELNKKKYLKALADRNLEFYRVNENDWSTLMLTISNRDEEEDVLEPLVVRGKTIGVVLKYKEEYEHAYASLVHEYKAGEELVCSLVDNGKAAQVKRFEKCLDRLVSCNSRADIRVLRWLMEYANSCGRALDKKYWEEITEFKNTNLNKEQQEAVRLILNTTDIGFIMGPPGTGKTSVIAEAIYQLAKRGKKILLSSQSNDAIDNALDRLKANPDIRAVRLVNKSDYPDKTFDQRYFAWNMVSSLDDDIQNALGKLNSFLARFENSSPVPQGNDQLSVFKRYICGLVKSGSVRSKAIFQEKLRQDYPWYQGSAFHVFLSSVINVICGRPQDRFIRLEEYTTKLYCIACRTQGIPTVNAEWVDQGVEIIRSWQGEVFVPVPDESVLQRQREIRQSFTNIREALNAADFDAETDADTMERSYNEDYSSKLVHTANVFGITCNANDERLLMKLLKGTVEYDYVIIDEVSKATTLELLTPMLKAPKCILIGDHHQLPPVFLADDDIKDNEELCYKYEDLITNTFFKSYFDAAPEASKCVLRKQYRMHSEISDIAVADFYKAGKDEFILENGLSSELESRLKAHDITLQDKLGNNLVVPGHHLYWMDSTPYDQQGQLSKDKSLYEDRKDTTSCANEYEIRGIVKLLEKLEAAQATKGTETKLEVGIISFYSLQNRLLRKAVDKVRDSLGHLDIDVNTVDRFQGQEREVIIVSLVRSKMDKVNSGNEFFRKYERINVAFSRAQKLLFIVGSERFCKVQSVPVDYISLTGSPEAGEETSAEEMVYADIIEKLKEKGCFFNISALEG